MKFKGMILVMGSIFLGGCAASKVQSPPVDNVIYKTDYQVIEDQLITLQDLAQEIGEQGVQLAEYDLEEEGIFEEYYLDAGHMNVNISTKTRQEKGEDRLLQRVQIRPEQDGAGDLMLHENAFLKSLLKLMDQEQIIPWLEELENQYGELKKQDDFKKEDEIADMKVIGRTTISFIGSLRRDYKMLEISWGNWTDIPMELAGIGAELEHQGLLMVDWAKGFRGNMIKMEGGPYHLIESNRIYSLGKKPVESRQLVAYKVMYEPANENHYSAQVYGLIPQDSQETVAIQDMVGIDAISRVMDMSWEDFHDLTGAINQEIVKFTQSLKRGQQREYKGQGQVGGYSYEIYGEEYTGFYRFTVLIEKV